MPGELKTFTLAEVQQHNTPEDCWVIIDGDVYNVSKFSKLHPGGAGILTALGGQDVTKQFYALHRENILKKYKKICVGRLEGAKPKAKAPLYSPVPYAEAAFWSGWKSPYYTESHIRFKKAMREFVNEHILPIAERNDDSGKEPDIKLYQKLGAAGILAGRLGPGPHLQGRTIIGGVRPEEFDYFHELIIHQELAATGCPGFTDSLACGMVIGLPPVLLYAKPELKSRVVGEVLNGDKRICLAISEPAAGSDVAGITCTAVKTADGKHYIVNGVKKWITNGNFCDYFTTAVVTKPGARLKGMSLLLIERGPGVTTKKIKTSYSPAAGTSLVIFENVMVPVENLLGKENQGFKVIVTNFNHERWYIVAQFNRLSRKVVEECVKWAHQRKAFGKRLIDQPVIRAKIASMLSHIESVEAWLEYCTYQMCNMTYKEQQKHLAGPIALLKLRCTRAGYHVNDEACQVFGGRAITRTGMGSVVEKFTRAVKFGAILGGSEEIMADLGVRQSMAAFPITSRL